MFLPIRAHTQNENSENIAVFKKPGKQELGTTKGTGSIKTPFKDRSVNSSIQTPTNSVQQLKKDITLNKPIISKTKTKKTAFELPAFEWCSAIQDNWSTTCPKEENLAGQAILKMLEKCRPESPKHVPNDTIPFYLLDVIDYQDFDDSIEFEEVGELHVPNFINDI